MEYLIIIIVSYLTGSISPSLILTKHLKGIDLRDVNSKSAGASNATLTLGLKWGVFVGVVDILKGLIPVLILRLLYPSSDYLWMIGGLSVMLGHIYPIYSKFKGGKGTSTYVGIIIGATPLIGLVLMVFLIISTIVTDYVVTGTIMYIIAVPLVFLYFDFSIISVLIVILMSILSFYKHFENTKRWLKKEELGFKEALKK